MGVFSKQTKIILFVLILCTLATASCASTKTNFLQHDDVENHILAEHGKARRSINRAVAKGLRATQKLLSSATKMKGKTTTYRTYEKSGDIETAMEDFYSVQPTKVQRKLGKLPSDHSINNLIGQVGNKRLILRTAGDKFSKGRPVLEIRSPMDNMYDRILYKRPE